MRDTTVAAAGGTEPTEAAMRILARVGETAPGERAPVAVEFARVALRRVPPDQLRAADPGRTARELVDAFLVADGRGPGEIAIRVFTPDVSLDGWSDPGTVVQVVSEDRPFLLSTVTEELEQRDLQLVRSLHPVLGVRRDEAGRIVEILPARTASERESFLHLEVDAELDRATSADLRATLRRLVEDVLDATDDYHAMRDRVTETAAELIREPPPGVDPGEAREAAELLQWLLDDNLVLLGWREYRIVERETADGERVPHAATVPGSGLGILRDESQSRFAEPVPMRELPRELQRRILDPAVLTISRTNRVSTVHRRARMDYFGVRVYDDDGRVVGERRLLGLLTRKAYTEPAATTPVLRRRLSRILEVEDVVPGSHDEQTLVEVFQAIPKDELFQTDVAELHELITGLLAAEERGETRVMLRLEQFTRTVSVLVAVPRDRYSPDFRRAVQDLLRDRFGGTHVDLDLSLGDRTEAIARFTVYVEDHVPDVRADELQREVRRLARSWTDDVIAELTRRRGAADAQRIARLYVERLPRAYRDTIPPERALRDLTLLDTVAGPAPDVTVSLETPRAGSELERLKLVVSGEPVVLSDVLPLIETLGLTVHEELPFALTGGDPALWIHDLGVRDARGAAIDVGAHGPRIAEAVLAAWHGRVEVDSLNRLVLRADLTWDEVAILRAYRRLRRQFGTAYTPEYVNDALVGHPEVSRALTDLFAARFDPDRNVGAPGLQQRHDRVTSLLDEVRRLDHDRILRGFLALVDATVRTNAYRSDAITEHDGGEPIRYLSLKLDSRRIPDVPTPVPHREIFVYSPEVEGVHLRGGHVARGGLRWSDRQDDVRTEVLGLMKAQMLKNALIVPAGAKGGFVPKRLPDDPDALAAEVRRQYVVFVRGLLDVTDNLVGDEIVAPPSVRRHDDDDPYLVVAADRGTASFSDLANEIAADYGFWLDDAFASGGSQGYDHKALGITARGAWVAVRRHFRELGIDPEHDPVTAVGIGDMSGDVFGNGMLQSRSLRLVAAFDHRHIFLDPDPDAAAAFEERRRLFELPGSSWDDYDRGLISSGGGVFPRAVKSIALSDEVRDLLRLDADALTPPALIRAILCAPVDLLFAGGIGTYVKATTESHDDIGDRTNDELRIDAIELRARVVGEGANLSITQAGRIQYARRGGRINQDAIDNAGGVAISDREVNLKILLDRAVEDGRIDHAERNRLLAEVTDEVVDAVLRDVDLQTGLLSREVGTSPRHMDAYELLLAALEERGVVDRRVAVLPETEEMVGRTEQGAGLTRPELATLAAATKSDLAASLLDTELVADPAMTRVLESYFPAALTERFRDLVHGHRLRDELIATLVANDVVNRMGVTFVSRVSAETGASIERIVAAYWAAREVADADTAWSGIEDLAGMLAPERVMRLHRRVCELVDDLTRIYVTEDAAGIDETVGRDRPVFEALRSSLLKLGSDAQRARRVERIQALLDDLLERDLAIYAACTDELALASDIATVARRLDGEPAELAPAVGDAFLRLGAEAGLDRVRRELEQLEGTGRWHRWQRGGLLGDLRRLQRDVVAAAIRGAPELAADDAVAGYLQRRRGLLRHALELVRGAADADPPLEALAVATRALRDALDPER